MWELTKKQKHFKHSSYSNYVLESRWGDEIGPDKRFASWHH